MFRGGLGSGKSHAGAVEFLLSVLENYEAFSRLPLTTRRTGLEYMVGAPTYQLAQAPWSHLTRLLEEIEVLNGFSLEKRRWMSWPRKIELVTGDLIHFVTLPGKIAGSQTAGFWFDESELSDDPLAGFVALNNRMRDLRAGRLFGLVTSSPKGRRGCSQFFEEQVAAKNESYGFVVSSTTDNPAHASGEYIDALQSTMTAREIAENLRGELVSEEGTVYGMEMHASRSIDWEIVWKGPRPGCELNLCIDWPGNASALLIQYDPATDVDTVIGEWHTEGQQHEIFVQHVVDSVRREFGLAPGDIHGVWCDPQPRDACRVAYRYWRGRVHHRRIKNWQDKKSGVEVVRWRLLDHTGKRRLKIAHWLRKGSKRRLEQSLLNYYWREKNIDGEIVRLDAIDQAQQWSHAADALRAYCWPRYSHLRWTEKAA